MISEMAPRGKPSITASIVGRPMWRISRGLRSERNPSVVESAALRFIKIRLLFAYLFCVAGREFVKQRVTPALKQWIDFRLDVIEETVGIAGGPNCDRSPCQIL